MARRKRSALSAPRVRGRRRLWRIFRFFPLTLRGASWGGLSLAAFYYGRTKLDLVVTLAGLWSFCVWGLSLLAVLLVLPRTKFALKRGSALVRPSLHGMAGAFLETGFDVPGTWFPLIARPVLRWFPPAGDVMVRWNKGTGREIFRATERCLLSHIVREVELSDLLGFWRFRLGAKAQVSLRCLPDKGGLSPSELAASLASGDLLPSPWGPARGDLTDFRPYTRSDPARLILWKVFARTRQLMVRAPEPARSPEGRPLVYLVAGPGDEAAAGCALALLESGLLGPEVRFAADGHPVPTGDLEIAKDAIAASVSERHRGAADFDSALAHPSIEPGDPVIVVCPATPGPWVCVLLPALSANPERFSLVATGDAEFPASHSPAWRTLFVRPLPRRPSFVALAAGLRPLTTGPWRVLLVDRISGRARPLSSVPTSLPSGFLRTG